MPQSAVRPISFSDALKQNLSQQHNKVKVRAPRLPPAFSSSPPPPHRGHAQGDDGDDEEGELDADSKDPFRSFGKAKVCFQSCFSFLFPFFFFLNYKIQQIPFPQKPFHGGPSVYKNQKHRQGKPTRGFS